MTPAPLRLSSLFWLLWVAYWFVSAWSVKPAQWRESRRSRASHLVAAVVAGWLIGAPRLVPPALSARMFPWSPALAWLGAGLVAAGLGFSVWARVHLGRNWSGSVAVKQDHELIRTGPYRRVRHPIYTGIIIAFLGTTLVLGQWRALLALVLITASLVRKLRLEEAQMRRTFPAYEAYRRSSAALVPFIY